MINHEDLPHLHNIGYGGVLRTVTPDDVAERIISQGLARLTTAGTLMLTNAGYMKLEKPNAFVEMGRK